MDTEKLINEVIAEVLCRLAQQEQRHNAKILALFTGGTIGLQEGLAELQKLKAAGAAISVVLSAAAEKVIGQELIRQRLGADTPVITAKDAHPSRVLREAELVVVPVLTQNTAAKLAHTLADTLVPALIMQGLMLGKPVLAAQNAADPQDAWRVAANMGNGPQGLVRVLQDNLRQIASYGIELLPVQDLAGAAEKIIKRSAKLAAAPVGKKSIVDAEAVKTAAAQGLKQLTIAPGAIVTPLAWDVAKDHQVEIIKAT